MRIAAPGSAAVGLAPRLAKRPTASPAEIRRRCRRHLPAWMVPRKVVILDHMPVTPSGRIDRRVLSGMLAESG
ncbi:AMP-binding enzyme [Albidovulum sp.]